MMTSTSTSSLEQQTSTNKFSFPNTSSPFTSSQATTSLNSNPIGSTTGRYSPSNFYRAAAVAAVTSDPNNRRYMPSTPVCEEEEEKKIGFCLIFRLYVCPGELS
jgi:hypothetical protein